MSGSPEHKHTYRRVQDIPVLLRGNLYSIRMGFSYDSGGPLAESVIEVMTALGKDAENVSVSRAAIDFIEVVSPNRRRLRRTVSALVKALHPVGVGEGFASLDVQRETIYPRPDNP